MLNPEQIQYYWPKIQDALDAEPELWQHSFTKDSLLARSLAGKIQVWAVSSDDLIHLCFMTQVYTMPANNFLQIFWMYGEGLKSTLPMIDVIMDKFAIANNCQMIEVVGRKGFERILKPFGAEFMCSTYSRPVRLVRGH